MKNLYWKLKFISDGPHIQCKWVSQFSISKYVCKDLQQVRESQILLSVFLTLWADLADYASTENFYNFVKSSYIWGCFFMFSRAKKIHNRLWHIHSVYTIGCVRDQRTSMFPVLDTNLCTFLSCYLVIDFLRTPKFFVCSDPQRLQLGSGQCRLFDLHQLRLLTEFQVRQRYLVILHNEKRSSRCEWRQSCSNPHLLR